MKHLEELTKNQGFNRRTHRLIITKSNNQDIYQQGLVKTTFKIRQINNNKVMLLKNI